MYASVRVYENGDLADYLAEHTGEVLDVIGRIAGFNAYHLIKTGEGRSRSASSTARRIHADPSRLFR